MDTDQAQWAHGGFVPQVRGRDAIPATEGQGMNRNLYRILATVWAETGVSLEAMQATERQKRTVMARRLFVGLARALTPCSFPEIQRVFGEACHSSSVDRHQQHERELRVNAEYSLTYWKLYRQLRQVEAA